MRLMAPYPPNRKADRIIAALGEDFYHDDIHDMHDEYDDTPVADDSSTDEDDDNEHTAVADANQEAEIEHGDDGTVEGSGLHIDLLLSAEQADDLHNQPSLR